MKYHDENLEYKGTASARKGKAKQLSDSLGRQGNAAIRRKMAETLIKGRQKKQGGGSYTIKRGDNLSRIARRHGMSLPALLKLNPKFKDKPNLIKPGQKVILAPGAKARSSKAKVSLSKLYDTSTPGSEARGGAANKRGRVSSPPKMYASKEK